MISPVSHSKIELRLKRFGPWSRKEPRKLRPTPKWFLSFLFTIGFSQRTLRELPRAHVLPYGNLRSAQSFLGLQKISCVLNFWCGASVWVQWEIFAGAVAFELHILYFYFWILFLSCKGKKKLGPTMWRANEVQQPFWGDIWSCCIMSVNVLTLKSLPDSIMVVFQVLSLLCGSWTTKLDRMNPYTVWLLALHTKKRIL